MTLSACLSAFYPLSIRLTRLESILYPPIRFYGLARTRAHAHPWKIHF